MHSIVMSSSPAFLTISSFIASPTPCRPFLSLAPLQSPLKTTRHPDATISDVLLVANPKTTLFTRWLIPGFTYLQSMDFQRELQSKNHLYCEQEKPAHCHGSLLLRLGTHQIQNRTRDAHKISPHGTITKRTPAMNWDHAVSWGRGLG